MDLIQGFRDHWLAALTIIAVAVLCFYALQFVFRFLQNRLKNTQFYTSVRIIGRILRGLVIFFAILSLAYLFANTQEDELFVERNFNIILRVVITGLITIIVASVSRAYFTRLIDKMSNQQKDTTKYQFFRSVLETSVYFIGFVFVLLAFPGLTEYSKTLLGGAGILAVIVGFAAQEAISNIIAGLFIIFSEPFKIGDLIQIHDNMVGTVWDISLRHTILKDFDNKMIVVPNSVMNKEKIFNFSLGDTRSCQRLAFSIDYTSDVDLARKIMEEEVEKHPLSIDPRTNYQKNSGAPRVVSRLINISDSALVVRVWAWAKNYEDSYELKCDLLDSIKKRFDQEGIVMPYPHTTMTFRDEDLEKLKSLR